MPGFDDLVFPAGEPAPAADPREAMRRAGRSALPKRFWREAGVADAPGGHVLTLDGRPARTPARAPLAVPTRALAEAMAAEWDALGDEIDPARLPLTRIVNSAIDGVARAPAAVAAEIVRYAGSDLLCYRAGEPERLVAMQALAWDPVLAWAREALGARFVLAQGVTYVEQPPRALERVAAAVAAVPAPFSLAALHVMTTLTGSALLALAVLRGSTSAEAAWATGEVDETFQAEVWGRDAEAETRRTGRLKEFMSAYSLHRLVAP